MQDIALWGGEAEPALTYYPATNKTTDATVVICPGGAYWLRAPHEGEGYALHFNALGMDAFVCNYRVAPNRFPAPLLDIRRAIRYVRANAEQFDLDPQKIAVMGSSAGGHLAALVSTYIEPIEGEEADDLVHVSALPNASILCYPVICAPDETEIGHRGSFHNLLGEDASLYQKLSCDRLVGKHTPPAFLWHTSDDGGVNVINSYLYASALRRHGIAHELHVFPEGPHGLGLADAFPHVAQWVPLMEHWLQQLGWIGNGSILLRR